ncbi:DivIVA domain-containing protein [Geopsychrobacter electrodiphilus]|uniref:DivIVA domain-containing protein n=1 Tax=Geopsychrobacter electrodiphilus TaxID=225196 RepID=UPI00037243CB|nr:DivIVA domain-containing protein [Geopsychrobacter electrodiphilus]
MKITPIEIQQHRFKTRVFGYDSSAVDQFLEMIADELESLHKQNNELKEALARTRTVLDQMKSREQALQQTLMTAQQVTEELKNTARKEAELVMVDARMQGEQIVRSADERRLQLIREIQEIKRQKISFESSLRAMVDGHLKLLDMETFTVEECEEDAPLLATQRMQRPLELDR